MRTIPVWKLAGGAVLTLAGVGLIALAAGLLLSDPEPDSTPPQEVLATATPPPESLSGDETLDAIIDSLLQDDAAGLATAFPAVTAREGHIIGGPVGFYLPEPVTATDWTNRLAEADRTLIAVVRPIEPDNPAPVSGTINEPSALLFDQQRDYDIVLLANSDAATDQPWRFSVKDGEVIDVIIDVVEETEGLPGPYPLLYRLSSLMPSPDDDPKRFLVLPPDAYWPIPERLSRTEPQPPNQEPPYAPDGRTGDIALDAVIDTLVNDSAVALQREFGDLAARVEDCIPIPNDLGACQIEYRRVGPDEWIDLFASASRSLYAVTSSEPVDVIIAADTGQETADAWRFGVRNGELVDIEFRRFEPVPLDPRARPDPLRFWTEVRVYAPDPAYDYDHFLVLPPQETLPQPPAGHDLTARTGNAGVDRIIAMLDAGDADGLIAAVTSPGTVTLRTCRFSDPSLNGSAVDPWARDTADRAVSIRAVANAPASYHPTAQHVIEVVIQVNPFRWEATGIMEADGEIVGIILGEECFIGALSPGPRTYLIPPLDITLQQFDSSRRSGVPIIDAILDALQSGDDAAWDGLIDYRQIPCTETPGVGMPPPCPPGTADGTPIDAITSVGCEGGFLTRETGPPRIEIGGGEYEVYAVVASRATLDPLAEASAGTILLVHTGGGTTALYVDSKGSPPH